MQVFANVATQPERKTSKSTGKHYFEFRVAESQRGLDAQPTWFTCRVMKETMPELTKGDFVKVNRQAESRFLPVQRGKADRHAAHHCFRSGKDCTATGALCRRRRVTEVTG